MSKSRIYSLAFLTVSDCSPVEAISVAAEAGYDMVGLRLLPATIEESEYPLLTNNKILREVKSALLDTGVKVGDIELIRIKPNFDVNDFLPFLSRASELGAINIVVVGDDDDKQRLIDNFCQLCVSSDEFGLIVNLEPIPWTSVPTLVDAKFIIDEVKKTNTALLIDALHMSRSNTPLETLGEIPKQYIQVFQICDAPALFSHDIDEIKSFARTSRLVPGEGELDLLGLMSVIPDTSIVSIEVPNCELIRSVSPLSRATLMLNSTKDLYSKLPKSLNKNG